MNNAFEPYHKKGNDNEFNVWKYQPTEQQEAPVVIDEHAAFLAECERLRQDAIKKGYEQGLLQAQIELNDKKKEFAAWFDFIKNPVKLLDEQITQEMLQTLIWLCQHCIAVELSVNPDKLRTLLNDIKTELPALSAHRMLAMHPLDAAWVQAEMGENEIPGLQDILTTDSSLNRGDFYLKGEHSELDGRIHTRFATLFAKYITKDNLTGSMPIKD